MPAGSDLVIVTIKTTQDSEYIFPDMSRQMLENVIKNSGWLADSNVVLVNVSGACLVIAARIVKSLSYDGEVRWPRAG